MVTWLFVGACGALGTFLLVLARVAFRAAENLSRRPEEALMGARLKDSALTLLAFGALLSVMAVALGGITFLGLYETAELRYGP